MTLDRLSKYVLLDDARSQRAAPARLYRDPVAEVVTETIADVPALFAALRKAADANHQNEQHDKAGKHANDKDRIVQHDGSFRLPLI